VAPTTRRTHPNEVDLSTLLFGRGGPATDKEAPSPLMAASAITIGSGGAAGRQGPIALISAGVGSAHADLGRRTEEERRILILVGMAAGLSAIFRSPLGAAVFAIEVLYRDVEYEVRALLYALLAAVVAYTVNGPFVGWEPLFNVPGYRYQPTLRHTRVLPWAGGGRTQRVQRTGCPLADCVDAGERDLRQILGPGDARRPPWRGRDSGADGAGGSQSHHT